MYKMRKISGKLYEWLVEEKIVDAALVAKWKTPGFEAMLHVRRVRIIFSAARASAGFLDRLSGRAP